ncbi:MAG TPA: radical SAM family heme chaperone HemW [Pyrinomonadaceae bacterium]|nr:radical SAM family heme chaperone HemW [Pyrinomonadaceae bacterium]
MSAGIYLHIPFCKSRCSYCDFATDVWRSSNAVERYVDAICSEVRNSKFEIRNLADTIYFGGGTPSLLNPAQIEKILNSVLSEFSVANECEITMEMNPATVTPESLAAYRALGVNRASFGVQTFDDRALKLLARGHDANDARLTFKMLRDAGFDNVSFDLIAGLPGQTLDVWQRNLAEAIAMSPEHLSLYLLEIHEGTPLAEQLRSNRQPQPDPELAAEMYEVMLDRLSAAGYKQYEISNFSKPGYESRHNSKYWTLDPVFGFGVSAHSFDGEQRYANERDTAKYVELIGNRASTENYRETIDIASEYVFLGLRLENGIDLRQYRERFGKDLLARYRDEIELLRDSGLVEIADDRIKLTRKGKLYSNEVFAVFV